MASLCITYSQQLNFTKTNNPHRVIGATMAAMVTAVVAVRTLAVVFGCVGIFAFAYVFAVDRYSSCFEAHNRWLMALNVDFYINVAVIAAWVIYKESSWIIASIVTVLLAVFGSIATCGYILMQLFKLSPAESSKDLFYFLLVKHHKEDVTRQGRGASVVTARVTFSVVGCLMLGTFVYLLIVDGSPFHAKVFTPCMIGTLTDFYANIAVLSMWIAYKESSWINAFIWILLLVCFGSVTTCAYLVRQTFYLSHQQHISLIIFNSRNRDLLSSEPLLITQGSV
ncbi:hypothetical protein SSX86_006628 [Deinandra increscens subsp. villosa]|uniref:Uncharacterized protein n=1 Tax=Deinandra increscens subsp. villosa TaxID=3103831 RepID=A0AAP0DN38_9ASTR